MNPRLTKQRFSNEKKSIKPFFSVFLIIATLFGMVFLKMEERRMSYEMLRLSRAYKKIAELKKQKEIELTKFTRPQYVETIAKSRLTLKKAQEKQIIHLQAIPNVTLNR